MSLGRAKVLAHVDDDDQRSVPKSEIDELTQHSGKNLRGYMPSAFPSPSTPRPIFEHDRKLTWNQTAKRIKSIVLRRRGCVFLLSVAFWR